MVLFGLLVATLKCVLYGLVNTSLIIVLINRMLQGAISACTQTMAMARIRDVYDQSSAECTFIMGVAMCKFSISLFAGLFAGELFGIMASRMYLLFLPVIFLLSVGILLTFRNENIHSQGSNSNETLNRRDTHASTHPDTMRRRALWDIQVIIISLCFFVASLGHTAFRTFSCSLDQIGVRGRFAIDGSHPWYRRAYYNIRQCN